MMLTQCAVCGKPVEEEKMKTHGDDVYVKKTYYCGDDCWSKRGRVIGSEAGLGCPFYNEDRMCVPPGEDVSVALPCSLYGGSYRDSCYVYPIHASKRRL